MAAQSGRYFSAGLAGVVVNMENLNLKCDFRANDRMEVEVAGESDKVEIAIHSNGNFADVLIGKEKSTQLRDWLNEFLGEPK